MSQKTKQLFLIVIAIVVAAGLFGGVEGRGAVITGADKPIATQGSTGEDREVKGEKPKKAKKKTKAVRKAKKKARAVTASKKGAGPTAPPPVNGGKTPQPAQTAVPAAALQPQTGPTAPPTFKQPVPPPVTRPPIAATVTPLPSPAVTPAIPVAPRTGSAAVTEPATAAEMPLRASGTPVATSTGRPESTAGGAPPALATASPGSSIKIPSGPPAGPATGVSRPVHHQPVPEARYITIDFDNVDIQVFARFISEMTGKNFVFDEKVRGKVTVLSPRKISTDEAYKVFESVLEVNGFAAIPAGDVIKIVPAQVAREKQLETRLGFGEITPEDRMVTQIIPLNHASPDEMKKVLDPLIAKTSVVISYPPTGMLIVTDLLSNIKKLQGIVEAMDQEGVGEQITYIPLKYAVAADVVKALTSVFQQQKGDIAPRRFVADERTNALIVMATESDTERIKELIDMMDQGVDKGALNVYKLQNAWAEDLAKVLMNLPKTTTGTAPAGGAPVLSKNVQIIADKATNTLVISADRADYAILESIIKQLDANRPMVYIEALIMEVAVTKNFRLGVEWQGMHDFSYSGNKGGVVGGFSGDNYGNTAGVISSTIPALPQGMSLGVVGQGITVAMGNTSITFPNFAALVQAYQGDSDVSVLATPQLLTMNNEEAEINISKNMPYITRQDQTNTGVSATNYSNYDYKDVGIIIKITPHINEDGYIRLKIDQNVSSMDTTSDKFRPTTRKRSAKTTVMLKDGNTLVIGGLIQENGEVGTFKVPLLGDIPLLGWLFKYQRKTSEKTNLFFFVSPRIVRTAAEAATLTSKKTSEIGVLEEGVIRMYDPKRDKARVPKP